MERKLHEIPPKQRLLEISERTKGLRSLKRIRGVVSEVLKCGSGDFKEFSYKIDNHRWRGVIYLKRNNLMGTIFSLWDNGVWIIRGFPKIRYSHDSKVRDKECIAEEKVDGTNIGIWVFPNGSIMGKTRMVQRWDLGSKRAGLSGSWKAKFEEAPKHEKVYELAREGYLVFVELYGYKNPGEFVKYSVPIAFKVIGIVDRKDQSFLERKEVERLCEKYDLPLPEICFRGKLTNKEVERIEIDLEKEIALDGMEGLVAKYYDEKDKDSYFCKLKCERVKERAYKISHSLIPASLIRKAIKKAIDENPGETSMKVLLPFVIDELKEEFEESFLEISMGKIKGLLRFAVTPSDEVLKKRVMEGMKEIKTLGIDVTDKKNKSKVLSSLHNLLGDMKGGTLYKLYLEVLLEMKGKW